MKVYLVVIILCIYTGLETFLLIWIGRHQSGCNGFLYFVVKLLYGFDAFFLIAVFRTPNRQRSTPVA